LANLLILSKNFPYPLDSGSALRVYHSCYQLAKKHSCTLVSFGQPGSHVEALERQGIFEKIHLIHQPAQRLSVLRHLRWSNKNFIKWSMPEFYDEVVRFLKEQIQKQRTEVVIIFPDILTEFIEPLQNVKKIADNCDSTTLTYERYFEYQKRKLSAKHKLITWLTLQRYRNFERMVPEAHDRIISISPADLARLKELNPASAHKIRLIPNGVPADLLAHRGSAPEIENAVVFWGNLDFGPNYSAVHYFHQNIFRPFLSSQNIKWYIVGKNAGTSIRAMAENDSRIIVTGFIEHLYDFAARIPIMINPMQIGSGLKNKVLEAFALGRMVISNALGIEAIIGAQPGIHYLQAEQPEEFAQAILNYMHRRPERRRMGINARRLIEEKYTWDNIGRQWHRLIEEVTATSFDRGSEPLKADPRRIKRSVA
jgi:glycosyltransferase involved in cell wall biosynthesis